MRTMESVLGAARCAGILVAFFYVLGCGGPQEPAAEGESCYRDADCAHGLACVGESSDGRKCSRDVSGLVSQVEGPPPPPDAGVPEDDAGEPPADGG
jgi:hypothetical protein